MSTIDKIETVLRKNTDSPGITVAKIARLARTTPENVHKRIYDLRTRRELPIFSNTRGNKNYYRLAV